MTYAEKQTEAELNALEKRIATVYRTAYREATKEADEYFKKFEKRYEIEKKAYEDGAYTKEQFIAWYRNQIMRGRQFEEVAENVAARFTDANVLAAAYINDTSASIYSLNYNYSSYAIEKETGIAFGAYDENVVKRLIMSGEALLPPSRVMIPKSRVWNNQKVKEVVASSIIRGEGVGKLASGLQEVARMDRNQALRSARTMTTGATNGGKLEAYAKFAALGYDVYKEWVSTLDMHTRDTHQTLDGSRIKWDEEFSNGLMFPGDRNGEPREVYNCRCSMRMVIPEINGDEARERVARGAVWDDKERKWKDGANETMSGVTYKGASGTASYKDWLEEQKERMSRRNNLFNLDLQFFAARNIKKQTSDQIRKSIKTLTKNIEEHRQKIINPSAFYSEWDTLDVREKAGSIRHWEKEIKNFTETIEESREELRKRGDKL